MGIVKVLALAAWLGLNHPPPPSSPCARPCTFSEWGLALIRSFEGYDPYIYPDVAGKSTIGYGHLILPGEKFKEPLQGDDAEILLKRDAKPAERGVNRLAVVPLRQRQFDALGSFVFNLGAGTLGRSSLLKEVNAKRHQNAPAKFLLYNKAWDPKTRQRVPVRGLTIRREAEGKLYAK